MKESNRKYNFPVFNVHHDYSLNIMRCLDEGQDNPFEDYLQLLNKAGVDFECYTIGGDHAHFCRSERLFDGVLRILNRTLHLIENNPQFHLIRSADDIDHVLNSGKKGLLFTIEGLAPIEENLTRLHILYRLGLRSAILTWFKANLVGDGSAETRNAGLSVFGRKCIEEMQKLGVLVDISQSSEQTFWDTLSISTKPIIASHSNAYAICPHPRNLKDDQIKALTETGGLMCVHTFPKHVDPDKPSLSRMVDHIDYVCENFGEDYVGVGLNLTVEADGAVKMFNEGWWTTPRYTLRVWPLWIKCLRW